MVDIVKWGCMGLHPPHHAVLADFSIMMEYAPESGHCHSVYRTLWLQQCSPQIVPLGSEGWVGRGFKKGGGGSGALQCGVAATKRAEKYLASQDASHTCMYTFCMRVFVSVLG